MDDWFISFVLFVIAILLYFHVQNQYKTSEDLEIYETDFESNKNIQNTCSLKQPVLFSFDINGFQLDDIHSLVSHMHIKDTREYYQPDTSFVEPIVLKPSSGLHLLETDTRSSYFSCSTISNESHDKITLINSSLQPPFTIQTYLDLLVGSRKGYTPMTYHTYSQRYFIVNGKDANSGIRVKMCPWKNTAKLNARKDYEHFEFWSTMNMFRGDDEHFKILDFVVNPGYVLFIPSYWWYSIQFLDHSSCVTSFTYMTAVNSVANVKEFGLHLYHQPDLKQQLLQFVIPEMKDNAEPIEEQHVIDEVSSNDHLETSETNETSPIEDPPEKNQDVSLQLISELKPESEPNPQNTPPEK